MFTKKAIEFMEAKVCCPILLKEETLQPYGYGEKEKKEVRDFNCNKDVVIDLLKRGEKFEKIINEITIESGYFSTRDRNYINEIKQKHFPKEE